MDLRTPDGATLVWRDLGAGTPLVALHPHTATSAFFDPLAPALPGVRLIAPDRRGYGGSTRGEGYAQITQDADLLRLLDHLDLPRVDLLGVAAGGGQAAAFAQRWPERVAHLVLACSFLGQPAQVWQALTGEAPATGDAAERELSAAARATHRAGEWRAQVARNALHNAGEPPQPCTVDLTALANLDRLHLWTGAEDRLFTPRMLAEAGRLLPKARLKVLPGVAHAAPWEDPEGFATALTGVINQP